LVLRLPMDVAVVQSDSCIVLVLFSYLLLVVYPRVDAVLVAAEARVAVDGDVNPVRRRGPVAPERDVRSITSTSFEQVNVSLPVNATM